MKELKTVEQDVQMILDTHKSNLCDIFNIHNKKVLQAKQGVEEGMYQSSYLDKVLKNAKEDMTNMYQGYREELIKDLTNYRNEVDKEIRKLPKDTDYQKAIYNLQYLKLIEPKKDDINSQDIYDKEVYRIALESPHLASNVLNVATNTTEEVRQDIKKRTDILLGNDLVLYLDDVITEVSSTISPRREKEGLYVVKNAISSDYLKQVNTFDTLSFDN